jgi:hypothetical protein
MKFIDKLKDKNFKETILDSLCQGSSELRDSLNWVIDNKLSEFDDDEFDDVSLHELILPAVRRAWSMIFLKPPSMFMSLDINYPKGINPPVDNNLNSINGLRKEKLNLLQQYFHINEFTDYLMKTIKENKNCLNGFEYIDRPVELITLISNNYVSMLVDKVNDVTTLDEVKSEIRNQKLKKII